MSEQERAMEARVLIEVRACSVHKDFRSLIVNDTRHGCGKCCPRQYQRLLADWQMKVSDARELISSLECAIEDAEGTT